MVWVDQDARFVDVNDAFCRSVGYSREELLSMTVHDIDPDYSAEIRPEFWKKLKQNGSLIFETCHRTKEGKVIPAEITANYFEYNGKEYYSLFARDTTERKQAEEVLHNRELCLSLSQEHGHIGVWDWSPVTGENNFSDEMNRIYGLPSGTIRTYQDWLNRVHPDDIQRVEAERDAVMERGEISNLEFRIIHSSGEVRWVSAIGGAGYVGAGQIKRVLGINIDITERKRVEEALRESKEFTENLIASMQDGFSVLDSHGVHIDVNPAFCQMTGFSREELIGVGTPHPYWPPEAYEEIEKVFQKTLRCEISDIELTFVRKNGERFPVIVSPSWIKDKQGNVTSYFAAVKDITERKRAEEALRETQEFLTSILDNAPMLIYVNLPDNRYRLVNKAWEAFMALPREEAVGRLIEQEFSPKTACQFMEANQQVIDMGIPVVTEEFVDRSDGPYYFHTVKFPLRDTTDKVTSVGGISFDITERKRAEEALRKSEEKYRVVTENIPVAVYSALPDEQSTNLFVAGRCMDLTGYPAKSFLDNPELWGDIIHPEDRERVWQTIEEQRQQRNLLEIEYRIIMPDQSVKWIKDKATPVLDEEGAITRIDGFMEDITTRKKAEEDRERLLKQLRAGREQLQALSCRLVEVQEIERRNLVRKLHDEVGQNMTALSINMNIINSHLPAESSEMVSSRLKDSLNLIEETIGCIRDVMAELRPPVLDDYGLMAALNWYGKQFSERTGIATIVEGEELMPRLPLATETAFFRIAQEALTNVAKHAKAKQITITLKPMDEKISLIITDDGIGFEQQQQQQQQQWGLINMRERAHAVGGKFHIESAPGKGTKVVVEVPKN